MRRSIGAIAVLALLIGGLAWVNRGRPAPRHSTAPEPVPEAAKPETSAKPEASAKSPEPVNLRKVASARLVRLVDELKAKNSWYLEQINASGIMRLVHDADLVAAVEDLKRELGAEFGGVLRGVLGELRSAPYRSLVALMLGVGRDAGSVAAIASLLEEPFNTGRFAAASLGLIRAPEGVDALKRFYARPGNERLQAELGLALAGEIPFLIEEAKREIATSPMPDPKNIKYLFPNRWFAWAGVVTDEIVALTADGVDPRLRMAAMSALVNAGEAGLEKSLELYSSRPADREAILDLLMTRFAGGLEGDLAKFDRLLDVEDPALRVQHLCLAALGKSPKGEAWVKEHWAELSASVPKSILAIQVGRMGREDLLHEVIASAQGEERAQLIVQGYRLLPGGLTDSELISEIAEAVSNQRDLYKLRMLLNICPSVKGDPAPLIKSMEVVYSAADLKVRADVIEYAARLGAPCEGMLRRIVSEDGDATMRVMAARALMKVVPRNAALAEFLKANVPDLTKPQRAPQAAFDPRTYGGAVHDAYPGLLRDFYSAFGTREDVERFRAFPDQVTFDASMMGPNAEAYRGWLRGRCREAEDAVGLKD